MGHFERVNTNVFYVFVSRDLWKRNSNLSATCCYIYYYRGRRTLRRTPMIKIEIVQPSCTWIEFYCILFELFEITAVFPGTVHYYLSRRSWESNGVCSGHHQVSQSQQFRFVHRSFQRTIFVLRQPRTENTGHRLHLWLE